MFGAAYILVQGFHLGLQPFQNPLLSKFVLKSVRYTTFCVTVSSVVYQVALLSSYNSKVTVSSLCSLPVPIYPNLFEFFLNLFAFLSEKRGHVKKFDDQFLAKTDKYLPNFYIINLSSAIIPHSVQFGAAYIVDAQNEPRTTISR